MMCVRNITIGVKKNTPFPPPSPPLATRHIVHTYGTYPGLSKEALHFYLPFYLPGQTMVAMQITILQLLTEKKDELRVNAMALIKRN